MVVYISLVVRRLLPHNFNLDFLAFDAKDTAMTSTPNRTNTAMEIKQALHARGITIRQWAEKNGYPPSEVYKVLNGERKGLYGRAHEIAVAIGLKQDTK